MSKLFGWDLPPGVSTKDIDEAFAENIEIKCALCEESMELSFDDNDCIYVEPCDCKVKKRKKK